MPAFHTARASKPKHVGRECHPVATVPPHAVASLFTVAGATPDRELFELAEEVDPLIQLQFTDEGGVL